MSLWLVRGKDFSDTIIGCNYFFDEKTQKHQLWVTKPNNKTLLIAESDEKSIVEEIKEAIDFAIEHKDPVLRLETA